MLIKETNQKFEGNRTKWTECILYNALKFMKEAGRFARCPVRPESFRPDWESIRPENEVISPEDWEQAKKVCEYSSFLKREPQT